MQKGFAPALILVGVLVTAGLIGGAYYLGILKNFKPQPQNPIVTSTVNPDSTRADWKTYTNSSLGFSFSYPKELNYLYDQFGFNHPDNPEGNLLLQNYDGSKPRESKTTDFQIAIDAYKNLNQVTLDTYVKDPNKVWNQGVVQTFADITLGNEPALKGLAIQKNEKVPAIWVSHKGYILTIYLETPKSTNVSLFDQILSTFKFTPASSSASQGGDQNQTVDTSNWKTYTNNLYPFSVKLPAGIKDFICNQQACLTLSIDLPSGSRMAFESSPGTLTDDSWQDIISYLERKNIPYSYFDISGTKGIRVVTSDDNFTPFTNPLFNIIDPPVEIQGVVVPTKTGWVSFFLYNFDFNTPDGVGKSLPVPKDDLLLFNQILSTFKALN